MYEYEVCYIEKPNVNNHFFIYGYNFEDACTAHNLDPNTLKIIFQEFID